MMRLSVVGRLTAKPFTQRPRVATVNASGASRWLSRTSAHMEGPWDRIYDARRGQDLDQAHRTMESSLSESPRAPRPKNPMASLSESILFKTLSNNQANLDTSDLTQGLRSFTPNKGEQEPYHLHIYSHRHNTHVTCTKPSREPIISMSCGNIGFKKARRGTFDSAYSLLKYVFERLIHTGYAPPKVEKIELILRGFGQGREAAMKLLMSPEGKLFRDRIIRVTDSTRIKFGGTRSEKPRRL